MSNSFKMPSKQDLKGRSSTISNAFAISITPYITPDENDDVFKNYYKQLDIEPGKCAYCLRDGNGCDHLKALVNDGLPTGYITDIYNLVPCCQSCNSSKGSKSFKEWYKSEKNMLRLKKLKLDEKTIDKRYDIICKYEDKIPDPLDYEKIVGVDKWKEFNDRRRQLIYSLNENQVFCDGLSKIIMDYYNNNK